MCLAGLRNIVINTRFGEKSIGGAFCFFFFHFFISFCVIFKTGVNSWILSPTFFTFLPYFCPDVLRTAV